LIPLRIFAPHSSFEKSAEIIAGTQLVVSLILVWSRPLGAKDIFGFLNESIKPCEYFVLGVHGLFLAGRGVC